ncbi:MAG: glucosidase [Dermatophilaceae bacterium]
MTTRETPLDHPDTVEHARLAEAPRDDDPWRLWGPYVAGRQWGTVREDYSANGDAWNDFPFDVAHLRAYRWGEDGIAGLCDRYGFLNLAIALWNGRDDRLKERYFGLTNGQGNHGEDVKEYWWPLDATPTHSHARTLYRYPQAAYPYAQLRDENARRGRDADEYELLDTGVLDGDRFFDVVITHAKASPDDVCVTVEVTNRGPDPAPLHLLPQLWFRNTWAWGRDPRTPRLADLDRVGPLDAAPGSGMPEARGYRLVEATHDFLGSYRCAAQAVDLPDDPGGAAGGPRRRLPEVLVCDNETDAVRLYGAPRNATPYPKGAVDRAIVHGDRSLLNPAGVGTKVAFHYDLGEIPAGASVTVRLRLASGAGSASPFGEAFQEVLADRQREADQFYAAVIPAHIDDAQRHVARRAFAGLLWGKQIYRYSVREWLDGDPAGPPPPASRRAREPEGRNTAWKHLELADVISMPDEWEYPWFASWDLAFHAVTLAHIDPAFAKHQLLLMFREWSQHPDGQVPAYEWGFSDANPPVHAWAAWIVYQRDGAWDRDFLTGICTKMLLGMSWWVNRKDADGSDLFEGGFLGMDNISLFDRSGGVPSGWRLEQSDATSWMAFFYLSMLRIAQELARHGAAWDNVATLCLERFLATAEAMEAYGSCGVCLWDDADGFFYDVLVDSDGMAEPVRVRSLVGLVPLLAVALSPDWASTELPDFTRNLNWLRANRPDLTEAVVTTGEGADRTLTLALVDAGRYPPLLARLFDESEFFSPYGIRSLSAAYRDGFTEAMGGHDLSIRYVPGPSDSGLFGGNSNWRGPVWLPVNALIVDALRTYAAGAGAGLEVEVPTGSGRRIGLAQAADELRCRLIALFLPGEAGHRPGDPRDRGDGPLWTDHPTFSEYFHGDTGAGQGASHQTGWTALVAELICDPFMAPREATRSDVLSPARTDIPSPTSDTQLATHAPGGTT